MQLTVPLALAQVECAYRIYSALEQWQLADAALEKLADNLPGFTAEACLLKTVAVNSIYGTQLLATVRMAQHIKKLLMNASGDAAGLELVEQIAKLPARDGTKPRIAVSFASKFCHFFINSERFPIYDEAARDALKLHLGPNVYKQTETNPYLAFCANLEHLRQMANLQCETKQLDRYLWLTGMFMRWLKERSKGAPRVNVELLGYFRKQPCPLTGELRAMLPQDLAKQFPRDREPFETK